MVSIKDVTHRYGETVALDGISLDIPSGRMVGIIGPDGVGKSTLMALIAGSKKMQQGKVTVLGGDIGDAGIGATSARASRTCRRAWARTSTWSSASTTTSTSWRSSSACPPAERPTRVKELLEATGLGPFADRPAGKLSGGMKQKVGLCGALVHEPDLLILDEPTTGVDPLSRRQFWTLIDDIRAGRPSMSVVISTAYMDEAQQWDWIVAMDAGRVLATGTPAELMERTGTKDLEKCFIALLPEEKRRGHTELTIPPRPAGKADIAIDAKGLTRRFGDFRRRRPRHSVDRARRDLRLPRLQWLRQVHDHEDADRTAAPHRRNRDALRQLGRSRQHGGAQEPRLHDAGVLALWRADRSRRTCVLDARLYHIPPDKAKARIEELVEKFGLRPHLDALAEDLPMGLRQRLSLAVAVLHEPQMLILDEPTSGVDPVARDSFWELLIDLSRKQGVTIFVTTHFMNEGMRCDRISLMNAGKVLACDAPQKLIEARGAASLEDAFIGYMEDAIAEAAPGGESKEQAPLAAAAGRRQHDSADARAAIRPFGCAWAGCWPMRATRRCRSCAIPFGWLSPSSARRC